MHGNKRNYKCNNMASRSRSTMGVDIETSSNTMFDKMRHSNTEKTYLVTTHTREYIYHDATLAMFNKNIYKDGQHVVVNSQQGFYAIMKDEGGALSSKLYLER
jgi:ABC-type transport system involved in cytochrome bd biosynthesis fused ATPase/permease subunit